MNEWCKSNKLPGTTKEIVQERLARPLSMIINKFMNKIKHFEREKINIHSLW